MQCCGCCGKAWWSFHLFICLFRFFPPLSTIETKFLNDLYLFFFLLSLRSKAFLIVNY